MGHCGSKGASPLQPEAPQPLPPKRVSAVAWGDAADVPLEEGLRDVNPGEMSPRTRGPGRAGDPAASPPAGGAPTAPSQGNDNGEWRTHRKPGRRGRKGRHRSRSKRRHRSPSAHRRAAAHHDPSPPAPSPPADDSAIDLAVGAAEGVADDPRAATPPVDTDPVSPDAPASPPAGRRRRRAGTAGRGRNMDQLLSKDAARRRAPGATPAARLGLVGLTNAGNTCFMNAAVQCLSHTLPLAEYLIDGSYRRDLAKRNPLGSKSGGVATSFAKLVRFMWLGQAAVIDPSAFRRRVGGFASQFECDEQQDTQEFVSSLLDALHEDLNRGWKAAKAATATPTAGGDMNPDGSRPGAGAGSAVGALAAGAGGKAPVPVHITAAVQWQTHLHRNKSIVVDLFQGQLKSTVTCKPCGFQSATFDPFMYLSVPIVSAKGNKLHSLDDALAAFSRIETLKGDEQWHCPRCATAVNATKRITVYRLPPVLLVHMKRFKHTASGKRRKLQHKVRFPLTDLCLQAHMDVAPGSASAALYDLYAVTNHHGGSAGYGHYTAVAKNGLTSEWHLFNDSYVAQVPAVTVVTKDAYMLYYCRTLPSTSHGKMSAVSAVPKDAAVPAAPPTRSLAPISTLHAIPSPLRPAAKAT